MDRYEVVKDIGSGNFGVARLMRDRRTKELVAIKYIERGPKIDQNVQREIVNHRSLRHPNIIRFKEASLFSSSVFLSERERCKAETQIPTLTMHCIKSMPWKLSWITQNIRENALFGKPAREVSWGQNMPWNCVRKPYITSKKYTLYRGSSPFESRESHRFTQKVPWSSSGKPPHRGAPSHKENMPRNLKQKTISPHRKLVVQN